MTKKLGQAFQGLQVQGRARFALQTTQFPLETVRFPQGTVVASPQRAKFPLPKISSARGSKIPAGILCRGRIARASPMDEVGWMPTSSIKIERGQQYRFMQSGGTTWDGTPLTITHPFSPINCPVDSLWRNNLRTECLPCHIHVPTASIVEITAYKQILSNQRKRRLHFTGTAFSYTHFKRVQIKLRTSYRQMPCPVCRVFVQSPIHPDRQASSARDCLIYQAAQLADVR